jgi:hypothetical protein
VACAGAKASPEHGGHRRLLAFDGQARRVQAAADFYGWRIEAGKRLAKLPDRWFVEANWDHAKITRPFAVALIDGLVASVDGRVKRYGKGVIRLGDVMRVNRGKVEAPVGGVTLDSDLAPLCVEQVAPSAPHHARPRRCADGRHRFRVVAVVSRCASCSSPNRAWPIRSTLGKATTLLAAYADQVDLFGKRKARLFLPRGTQRSHPAEGADDAGALRRVTLPIPRSSIDITLSERKISPRLASRNAS